MSVVSDELDVIDMSLNTLDANADAFIALHPAEQQATLDRLMTQQGRLDAVNQKLRDAMPPPPVIP